MWINKKINKENLTGAVIFRKKILLVSISLLGLLSLSWCNNSSENIKKNINSNFEQTKISNSIKKTKQTIIDNTKEQVLEIITWQNNILTKYHWRYKGNTIIANFSKTKKILYKIYNKDLWKGFRKTIYCWCNFSWKKIDKKSCWLITKWYKKRSKRIEREHVVPAENFWKAFKSWREGNEKCKYYSKSKWKYINYKGRKCAEKASPLFNLMEADLYNLFPADGALNAYRSNYQIAEIPWEIRKFWKCDFEIDNRKVEPPQDKKGDIARVYMYMQLVYGKSKWLKIISEKNKKLIETWNKMDPISKDECIVYFDKKKYQKNINPILEAPCDKLLWK